MKDESLKYKLHELTQYTKSILPIIKKYGYCRCKLVSGEMVKVVKGYTNKEFTHFETKIYKNCLELNSKEPHKWWLNGKHILNENFGCCCS